MSAMTDAWIDAQTERLDRMELALATLLYRAEHDDDDVDDGYDGDDDSELTFGYVTLPTTTVDPFAGN